MIAFTTTAPRASARTVFIANPPSRPSLDVGEGAGRRQMDWLRIFNILDEFQCAPSVRTIRRKLIMRCVRVAIPLVRRAPPPAGGNGPRGAAMGDAGCGAAARA